MTVARAGLPVVRRRAPSPTQMATATLDEQCLDTSDEQGWKRDLAGLLIVFLLSLAGLILILRLIFAHTVATSAGYSGPPFVLWEPATWPSLPVTREKLRVPTLRDVQDFAQTLSSYTRTHSRALLVAHGVLFLFLQTFAIPGTVFCNLTAGSLFGLWKGFLLCLIYNTVGAVCLYMLSRQFGRRLVRRFFSQRLAEFEGLLRQYAWEHADNRAASAAGKRFCGLFSEGDANLLVYMISLRVFPFTPHWVVNVSSAQLNIPLRIFVPALCIGLAPYNFLAVKAGLILSQLTSRSDIINTSNTLQLVAVALIGALIPTLARRLRADRRV